MKNAKRLSFIVLSCLVLSSLALSALPVQASEVAEVVAEEEAVPLAVVDEQQEEYLSDVHFLGMLVELGSTEVPTNLVVRSDTVKEGDIEGDITVEVEADTILGQRRDQYTRLEDWIPGDRIRVIGIKDENSGVVKAVILVNHSIVATRHWGANGWIDEIDEANNVVKIQWKGKIYPVQITEDTHIVVPPKNPAEISDLKVGDRVRGRVLHRLQEGATVEAKILVVLRRGPAIFLGIRTGVVHAKLLEIESTEVPTTITIEILKNRHLRKGDANNRLGVEGDVKTVNVTEDTKIVRRFFGQTDLTEFMPGDLVMIVGKAEDDGTITARLLRDKSIWLISTKGYSGEITAVDLEDNSLTVTRLGKEHRVDVSSNTQIVVGTDKDATINDLAVGDKIRARGVFHLTLPILEAKTIVVVSSLPGMQK